MNYNRPFPFDNALWYFEGNWRNFKDLYVYKKEGTEERLVLTDKREPLLRFQYEQPLRLNGNGNGKK